MDKAWPSYINVQWICCYTKLEAFISEAFLFLRQQTGRAFWCNRVYLLELEPKGGGGGRSEHGDLSLFRHRIRICEKISATTLS